MTLICLPGMLLVLAMPGHGVGVANPKTQIAAATSALATSPILGTWWQLDTRVDFKRDGTLVIATDKATLKGNWRVVTERYVEVSLATKPGKTEKAIWDWLLLDGGKRLIAHVLTTDVVEQFTRQRPVPPSIRYENGHPKCPNPHCSQDFSAWGYDEDSIVECPKCYMTLRWHWPKEKWTTTLKVRWIDGRAHCANPRCAAWFADSLSPDNRFQCPYCRTWQLWIGAPK